MKKITAMAVIMLTFTALPTLAQSLGGAESVEMDQISIDGQYDSYAHSPNRQSRSDRMKKYREKLERKSEMMMQKKMEEIRYKNEIRLMKKMQKSMDQTLKAIDKM